MIKAIVIIISILVGMAILFQGWVYYSSNVEEQPYQILRKIDEVEIRFYPAARMASVETSSLESRQGRNSGFRVLAGYIFGGNETQESFAMTAPVHMSKTDTSQIMSFVLPEQVWSQPLPKPNDGNVQLHWSKEQTVAAIQFSGYLNEESYTKHKQLLTSILDKHGIVYFNDFRTLGYDPPYKLTDRRNEIIVSVSL